MNTIEILCDSHHGIHIPSIMIPRLIDAGWENIPDNVMDYLDPNDDWYWENWGTIEQNAEYTDDQGYTWYLYLDGDLFAYREDHEFN